MNRQKAETVTNRPGYAGKILRVDLSASNLSAEELPGPEELRRWVGGSGLGAKILYDEVPPGVGPYDPANRLIFASGPLGGTTMGGTGTFSVVTKGPMTNGSLHSQANGFLGAYLKFAGFDAVILQGAAERPVYLYLHDGQAELKDAHSLKGRNTWETKDLIAAELGVPESRLSVFGVGPAGENRVRFAAIVGDRGHVVAHGGPGAVMASKNLKAIAVARGPSRVMVKDGEKLRSAFKEVLDWAKRSPLNIYQWGTSIAYPTTGKMGRLPIRNYTGTDYPEPDPFTAPHYRPLFKRKRTPCWACQFDHCAIMEVKQGPYAGTVIDEPEYEGLAAWSCLIDQNDPVAAAVLSNDVDLLGMDTNEAGWIIAWVMECFERGLLTTKDTDGLEMTWGNVEATRAMLRKIANREGIGDILAEGAMRAARRIGGEAAGLAVYTLKGNTPRGHDHRSNWHIMLDVSTSDTGTDAAQVSGTPAELGLPPDIDLFTPEGAGAYLAAGYGWSTLRDSMGLCYLSILGAPKEAVLAALNAATGWDFTVAESDEFGRRVAHLLRAFDARHGLTPKVEAPSARYGSAAIQGPAPARERSILSVWEEARRAFHVKMGWDAESGRPLPETLRRFGLDHVVKDIW